MASLIWDEGMSVGVEAIDNEHKQIITMLAKLTSADHGCLSTQDIEEVFAELELYVSKHFAREEALLEKISYNKLAEHKASHQAFIEKIPQLKDRWLTEDNQASSEEITAFLHQWIIDHILEEDMDYAQAIHNYKSQKKHVSDELSNTVSSTVMHNNGGFEKLSAFFANKIKLSHRVFITTFFPVLALFIFYLVILFDNYRDYKNIDLVLGINHVIEHVDDISHSLQAERGLSSGFTSSNYQNFSEQLAQRRLITDKAINAFQQFLQGELAPSVQNTLQVYVQNSQDNFAHLKEYREEIDNKNVNFEETYQVYTLLIEQLLSISEHLIHIDMDSHLANDISAISAVLLFKEHMGQTRALGMNLVANRHEDISSNQELTLILGKQLNALRVFHYSASEEQKNLCQDNCNSEVYQQVLSQHIAQVDQFNPINQPGKYWFGVMSDEINQLKQVTDSLIFSFTEKVRMKSKNLAQSFYITLGILSILLLAASLFSLLLNYSIIKPIRRITYALNDMAKGLHHIQFDKEVANDEIGAMQTAFEKLRRKLLQMNIFQVTVDRQKSEIAYRKSQQAHYEDLATKDALTGAVNRHKFDLLLANEITKTNQHQQPLSILILDIDHFKQVNDSFGHGVGDEVLIMFYRACKTAVRSNDVVARIGGEEFVIILPNTDAGNAYLFAERLREKIQQLNIMIDDIAIELTVSIGVSQWQGSQFANAKEFVDDADKLLYQAKNQGRNKVVVR